MKNKLSVLLMAAALVGVARAETTKVSPEAQAVIARVSSAYSNLKSLELAGTYSADLDVAGKKVKDELTFTGVYQAPNFFRHEMKDDMTVGSTGEKVFAHARPANVYFTASSPKEKSDLSDLPHDVRQILEDQNPSLLLAVAKDPEARLKEGILEITASAPTTVDGATYDTLVLSTGADRPSTRWLIDPKTNLIRQAQTDIKPDLLRRGAPDVNKALFTINYTTITPDASLAEDAFAWSAPTGAREAPPMQAGGAGPTEALEGKPAPDFTLKQLGGGQVKLSDLQGSVVILDFWATWCPPCVEGLPHLDKLQQEHKDKGLKVFAINMQEEEADVKKFVDEMKLGLPVLLETDEQTAAKYKIEPIPTTVLIGRDGKVRKTFVGIGPAVDAQLKRALEAALNEK